MKKLDKGNENEKLKKQAEDERLKKQAEDERLKKQVENEKLKKQAEDEKLKKLAEDEKLKKLAEDEKLKKLAEDEKLKKLAEDEKLKKLAEDEKLKKLAEDEKLKKLAEDKKVEEEIRLKEAEKLKKKKEAELREKIDQMLNTVDVSDGDNYTDLDDISHHYIEEDYVHDDDDEDDDDDDTADIDNKFSKTSRQNGNNSDENSDSDHSVAETSKTTSTGSERSEAATFTAFERQVLSHMKEINSKVETVLMNQSKLNLHLLPGERVVSRPHGMPTLPVKSKKELRELEKYLSNSENITNLSIYLSTYVSKNEAEEYRSVMGLLPNLMDNSVAKSYSFCGRKGKESFINLHVWTAVKGAILCKIEDSDHAETKRATMAWLRDAAYRRQGDGSSSKRQGGSS